MGEVDKIQSKAKEIFLDQGPDMSADRVRRLCWGDFLEEKRKGKVTSRNLTTQGQRVQVPIKKTSGEIWLETEPLPVLLTISYIVFDVARVDRRDSVVPYLIYDKKGATILEVATGISNSSKRLPSFGYDCCAST